MANFLSQLFTSKKRLTQGTTSLPSNPGFRFIGGNLVPYNTDKLTYIEKAYLLNDIVYSIVKLILDKAVQAPPAIYTIQDEAKFFQYSGLLAKMSGTNPGSKTGEDFRKIRELRHKALRLDTSDEYLNELIKQPNENESFADHNYGLWGYKLITGDYFEAGWEPIAGGLNAGKPTQLYGLPTQFMSILASNSLPISEDGYLLQLGSEIPFSKADILHEKYWTPEWDMYGKQLQGLSPLRAALKRIQRNNEVVTRGAKSAENAGADVIVYMDSEAALADNGKFGWKQMGALKDSWVAEQAGSENAGKAVFSAYKVGATRLGLSPVELDLLASEGVDMRYLCNIYGVPSQMMNDPDNKTYANQAEGEKALTTRCAMPLLVGRQRNFNRKLRQLPKYKNGNKVFEFDMTVYTELEEDKVQLTNWLKQTYLPIRRQLEILNEDIPDSMTEEELNAIPVPSGMTLLSELFTTPLDGNTLPVDDPNNPYFTT